MLLFSEFLIEAKSTINDLVGGKRDSETERHRTQYYDDSHPDGSFNKISGRYVLDRNRTDIHPDFKKDFEIKLDRIEQRQDSSGVTRYHGIIGDKAIPMSHFKKPKLLMKRRGDTLRVEDEQVSSIGSQIQKAMEENGGKPIKIKTADGQVHNVAGIKSVKGNKKADAFLHDENGNPVHYMSLKGDTYQQWGGYTDIFDHPKTKKIISKFQELKNKLSPDSEYLPSGSIFHHTLDKDDPEEKKLIMRAMYGKKHGSEYGEENVHAIYGGNTVELRKNDDGIFNLHTNAIHVNTNDDRSDVTDAKIMLHKSSGHNQLGTGGRVTIQNALNVPSSIGINQGVDAAIQAKGQKKSKKTSVATPVAQKTQKPRKLSIAVQDSAPESSSEIKPKPLQHETVGGKTWKPT